VCLCVRVRVCLWAWVRACLCVLAFAFACAPSVAMFPLGRAKLYSSVRVRYMCLRSGRGFFFYESASQMLSPGVRSGETHKVRIWIGRRNGRQIGRQIG
jgi:hypothetical protein